MWLFYFQYGFRSSLSTANLLAVVSDRIARAFKVAHMVEIASFDPPQKASSVIYFQVTQLCFEIQRLALTYQKVSPKNDLCFLVKLSTKNSYFLANIFYFYKLQLLIKKFKRNQSRCQVLTN